MQLRFASFAVINLRRDLHPQECAHAGRTNKKGRRSGLFYNLAIKSIAVDFTEQDPGLTVKAR